MTNNSTRNLELTYNDALLDGIRKVFQTESKHAPSSKTLNFIFGYAAAYESVETRLMGKMEILNN
ncbi:MAG: hypothetical protein MJZ97_07990 [Bacteroidales bacterium]|nr:hypothetical protein [Bacteroidales bacterium]